LDYRESVDCVIGRARQVFGDQDIRALVRAGEAIVMVDPDNYRHMHAAFGESAQTMKEVVRRETRRVLDEQTSVGRKLRKFQRELDDDATLSRAAKRHVMGKFEALFEDVAHGDGAVQILAHGAGLCVSKMSQCSFGGPWPRLGAQNQP